MKFAVHCEPFVNSWTPGWMVAVAAGAHAAVRAAIDGAAAATGATRVAAATAEMMRERVRMSGKRARWRKLAQVLQKTSEDGADRRSGGGGQEHHHQRRRSPPHGHGRHDQAGGPGVDHEP